MPSPIGHALAGAAAAWLVLPSPAPEEPRRPWTFAGPALIGAAVAVLPDLDLLVGAHSGPTHGLGAALLAGLAAWLVLSVRRMPGVPAWRGGVAVAAAYASHTLLDWMGNDTTPPIGIMALWPFTREYYESNLHVFMAISRRHWLPGFWTHNLTAVALETAILAPILATIAAWRMRKRTRPRAVL